MKRPYYNIIISLFPRINCIILIIFIILADCEELNRLIKFRKDGNIIIIDRKNNNTTKTHLYSPLVYIKMNEYNINFKDNNIFPSESADFTYAVPKEDISLIDMSLEEFTSNPNLILKKYPNLLFNTNKTFSLFSLNINDGYLFKYEKYKSNFLEQNNFKFIKEICPNNKDEILFLRIDYFIQMKYTYEYKNNDIIWYSHHIKIIPIYPNIILLDNDIYKKNNKKDYDEDDFYIFEINNKTINVIFSQDKDLYAEIKDIQDVYNFNNYYFRNKKFDNIFQAKIKIKENPKKYFFIKFPKTTISLVFIFTLLIINFSKKKNKEKINKIKEEDINNKINIKTNEINNEVKGNEKEKEEENSKEINKIEKLNTNIKAKSITNLNHLLSIENKNETKEIKIGEDKIINKFNKIKSTNKCALSIKKKESISFRRTSYRKTIKKYKKTKKVTNEEKIELNLLFNTYLEDISNNNNNNDSTINLNLKTISIAEKYKKLYSLLEEEKSTISTSSILDYKEIERKKINQNSLKKEFQNNFNYIIDSGRLLKEFKDFYFIGKGGFGVVLKASNILDEGQWAIKIMRINLDLKKAKELKAIQEIKMMSKFKKKNIVRYKTCWFEFAQNDTINKIKKRERSASFDLKNKKEKMKAKNKINKNILPKISEDNGIIFEELKEKKVKRKGTVIDGRSRDGDIFEEKEEEIKIENAKTKITKDKTTKKKKPKTSMIWDDDEESDDSLGANKNYVIKEEGKNIPLDDFNDEEGEENSGEEDDEDNSSLYGGNQEIIKEEKNENSEEDEDEYKDLKYDKNEPKIKPNESSSNIISNSNNSLTESKKENQEEKEKEDNEQNNKNSDSKFIIYFFIQMEYCSGCPMNYYLSHRKDVPSKSLTSFMFFQMCYAVKHIHEANIIHRDLKPGNIFIMKDYLIKIGDFGLALNFGKTKNEQGGTYLYQSPEQIENKTYDQKVDIFALGVILLELVSKFNTEFERVEVLQGLKKNLYPQYLEKDHINEYNLIKKMTKLKKEERPNIQDIFNDSDFNALINTQ